MDKARSERGFTLIELLISMMILGLLFIVIGQFMGFGRDMFFDLRKGYDEEAEARNVIQFITGEIRRNDSFDAISIADVNVLEIRKSDSVIEWIYRNQDGIIGYVEGEIFDESSFVPISDEYSENLDLSYYEDLNLYRIEVRYGKSRLFTEISPRSE